MAEPVKRIPLAWVSPTDDEVSLDGVKARIWAGISELGTPLRLSVHRVLVEQEYANAFEFEFPQCASRKPSARMEVSSAVTRIGNLCSLLRHALECSKRDQRYACPDCDAARKAVSGG